MEGIKKGETRSGLYYEGLKILEAKRPIYSVIENVKNLTSKRFKGQFVSILNDLTNLGYINYWKVLNAKDYGIPQNRERLFIISIRTDIAKSNFSFPQKVPLKLKLKDMLEDNVEEKYYLSENAIGRLIRHNNKLVQQMKNPNVSSCLIAGYYKMGARDNQYISENVKTERIGGIYDDENRTHQAGSIYNPNGLSPTLTTMYPGGNKQPFILVNEGTKRGYTKATEGDSINVAYPNNITKRGRVGKEIANTILTSPNISVLENARKMYNPYNNKVITDIAPTQTTTCGCNTSSSAVLISEDGENFMRIRKLTPLECWRLMGYDDIDFINTKNVGISDTQLYKQAGNSIVVNVLEYIFQQLFIDECNEEIALKCA